MCECMKKYVYAGGGGSGSGALENIEGNEGKRENVPQLVSGRV